MKKKKLMIVSTLGVSFIFYENLIDDLKNEFDVVVCSTADAYVSEFTSKHNLIFKEIVISRNINIFRDIKAFIMLLNIIISVKPDIIMLNTPKASFVGLLAARVLKVTHRIYVVHGLRYQGFTKLKRRFFYFIEKINLLCATNHVVVSNGLATILKSENLTHRRSVIFNRGSLSGVDIEKFTVSDAQRGAARKFLEFNPSDFVYGFVGRVTEEKGILELLCAFETVHKNNNNAKLLLVGPLEASDHKVTDLINNSEEITFVDAVNNVEDYLAAMDIFVFPTYREGLGMSLIEAQLANVPVIATDVTGCNEIVTDNLTGILVEPREIDQLANRMEHLMRSPKLRQSLIENAHKTASLNYNSKAVCASALKFLCSLE